MSDTGSADPIEYRTLYKCDGSYTGYAWRTSLVRENATDERVKFTGAADVAGFMRDLQNSPVEVFIVLACDVKNHVIGVNEVSRGTLDASLVHPRDVFRPLVAGNAAACILVHNHPSGDPEPSPEDIAMTRRLADGGEMLGIPIYDHVIIGEGDRYVSLAERGVL